MVLGHSNVTLNWMHIYNTGLVGGGLWAALPDDILNGQAIVDNDRQRMSVLFSMTDKTSGDADVLSTTYFPPDQV
jgi:hypothetical protein